MLMWLLVLCLGVQFVLANECLPLKNLPLMLQYADASAKIPSGMMSGNLMDFGAFDQCLALDQTVDDTRYRGKYCIMKVPIPPELLNMGDIIPQSVGDDQNKINDVENRALMSTLDTGELGLLLGWCIPDNCAPENVTNYITQLLQLTPLENMTIYPYFGGMCQTKEDIEKEASTFSPAYLGTIGFLGAILCIMVLSTIYDIYVRYRKQKPAHIILTAFSVRTNGEKLLAISHNPDQLPSLHGIRFLSMMWVLCGHRFGTGLNEPNINLIYFGKWKLNAWNMYVLNATVSVDTFFFLSGFLVAYGFLLSKAKGVRFNVIIYWIHRYIRLTPALGVVILVVASILNRLGSGPFWPMVPLALQDSCKKYWWPDLLYIQNYYHVEEMCLGHTWYLAIDFQLFILSPIILIPLWRWPKYTLYASVALVFGCIVSGFVVTYHFDLTANIIANGVDTNYTTKYYFATHTRYGPWLIGLMMGYYIFKLKERNDTHYKLHPSQVVAGWSVCLALLLTVLYAPHNTLFEHDRLADAFFNGLHRHVWALGLCWVVYACTQGYGGPVNSFLSWSLFQVLGRFTYTMYLTHELLQNLMIYTARTHTYFTDFNTIYKYWGDFFITLFIAVCLTLSFESPILVIEKVIFGNGNPRKTKLPIHQKKNHSATLNNNNGQPTQN
ncbi:uncharacterized protein CBL_01429 [Carabus blaptoides fortunei]